MDVRGDYHSKERERDMTGQDNVGGRETYL
jgi:hypothetical protein